MDEIQLGDQIIRFDKEQTRRAYAAMTSGSAERCACSYCRNFTAQRSTAYPENFRLLLDRIGIDPQKEGEVYEGSPEGSLVEYGGWFYLAGELVEAGERMTDAGSGFEYFFRESHSPPNLEFGESVLALEFSMKLPWVLAGQWGDDF